MRRRALAVFVALLVAACKQETPHAVTGKGVVFPSSGALRRLPCAENAAREGRSLHVGVNAVSRKYYGAFDKLRYAEADAASMRDIAAGRKFSTEILVGNAATTRAVTERIQCAAKALGSGDTFVVTYAGHGSQVPDKNGDEGDRHDETWVLFDRELIDDELHGLLADFRKGVRVVVISDSCHSGTIAGFFPVRVWKGWFGPRLRMLDEDTQARVLARDGARYSKLQLDPKNRKGDKAIENARAVFLGACQDFEVTPEGEKHGRYTAALLATWANGKFAQSWEQFQLAIGKNFNPNEQNPSWETKGNPQDPFEVTAVPFSF